MQEEPPVVKEPDPELKMPPKKEEKSKEEIMAEREAKKAEKAAKKAAAKGSVCLIGSLSRDKVVLHFIYKIWIGDTSYTMVQYTTDRL